MPTKQKSGLYRAKVKIGVDEHGKDIYKYVSGKTKKELEAARQHAIAYYIEGTALADDVLFGPYAVEWFNVHKRPHIKPNSVRVYKAVLNNYILPEFGDMKVRAISVTQIQKLLLRFAGKASTYQTVARTIMRSIFDTAYADGIVVRNPMSFIKKTIPSKDKKEKRPLTKEERQRIVKACNEHPDALYVALMYYLGLRRGEAAGLKWSDINWREQFVSVRRTIDFNHGRTPGSPKTSAGVRKVPIPAPLLSLLEPQRGMPDMYILHTPSNAPKTATSLALIWEKLIVGECGITDITPHTLRHNYITLCWEAGIDVYATARFVGHKNISTTLRIYTHLSEERAEENAVAVRNMFAV